MRLPKNAIDIPGYIFVISRALAWNNISIIEVVSTYTELTILVKNNDATRAFDVLKETIKNNS
jgi:hypothetical protein